MLTLSPPVTGKPVKLSSSVRRRWPLYRSAISFPFHTEARFTGHEHMALFIMILRKYYLRMRGLWGPRGFAKDAGKCSLLVCEKKNSFSSSNWWKKHE